MSPANNKPFLRAKEKKQMILQKWARSMPAKVLHFYNNQKV
jgi:hypothetical protein